MAYPIAMQNDYSSVFRSGQAAPKGRVSERPLPCSFVILTDTREQSPFTFEGIRADSNRSYRPLVIETRRATLKQGDYSIMGLEDRIAIERKSKADLFGTLSAGRDRFERELERLADCVAWSAVVVEAELSEILASPPEFSNLLPKTVVRSVLSWMLDFPTVHWLFAPDRRRAELLCYRIFEKAWKRAMKT